MILYTFTTIYTFLKGQGTNGIDNIVKLISEHYFM